MRSIKSLPIAQRLSLVFFATNAFTLTCTFVSFAVLIFLFTKANFSQELHSITEVVAGTSRAALTFGDEEAASRILTGLQVKKDISYAAVITSEGAIFSEFGKSNLSKEKVKELSFKTEEWDFPTLYVSAPITADNQVIGKIFVIAYANSAYYQFVWTLLLSGLLTFVVALSVTLFSIKLKAWVSQPIISLKELAHEVSATKDFTNRLELVDTSNDEISDLVKAFNHMLSEISERDNSLIEAKERAEKADKLKSMFVASMSHEIRTPLHAILGVGDEMLQTSLTTEQEDLLKVLKTSGNYLLSLINDILDFASIEAGKLSIQKSTCDLQGVFDNLNKIFESSFKIKGVMLSFALTEGVPRKVSLDGNRLSQVLVNIIGNALKFTPTQGMVTVSLSAGEPINGMPSLVFCVKDSGIGIKKEQLPSIFSAFTQIREAHQAFKGTGIGLAICDRLVKLMGGKLWAESELGKGSEFFFSVTYQEVHAEESLRENSSVAQRELRHTVRSSQAPIILLVEDNPVNQKLGQRMLQKGEYSVIIANDGKECLDLLSREKVDLILMDINMPVMDGLEATRSIRELEKGSQKHVPIIALTANATPEDEEACMKAGMDSFLAKPVQRAELLSAVMKFLPRESAQVST